MSHRRRVYSAGILPSQTDSVFVVYSVLPAAHDLTAVSNYVCELWAHHLPAKQIRHREGEFENRGPLGSSQQLS